jgi:glutaredoxin 3
LLCLLQRTNRTSMPNIWIQGQPIGGCNDGPGLLTLARKGELAPMLKAAGAL